MSGRYAMLLFLAAVFAGQVHAEQPPITSARAILELAPEVTEKRLPTRIKGVVTCSDTHAGLLFVQDETAGIYVYYSGSAPSLGESVEVAGSTGKGLFSPIIMADGVKSFGPVPLPAPIPMAVEQMASGRHDSQWVEVEGMVLRAVENWGHLVLTLGSGSSRLEVRILNVDLTKIPNIVDARVKVKGVAGTSYNDRRQLTGFHLLTQNTNLITILEAPPADPFLAEVRVSRNLMAYSRHGASEHRMRLRGVVTFYWPGSDFFIRDEGGGVRVQSRETLELQPGDLVDVVGFPTPGRARPFLQEAVYRKYGAAEMPRPQTVGVKEAAAGAHEFEPITIEGNVLQTGERHAGYMALVLEDGGKVFRARYQEGWKLERNDFLVGGRVRVSGVCAMDSPQAGATESFSVWMRRPEDFAVIARPPAWKQRQMMVALGGLGGVVLLCAAWVILLRQRVRAQTAVIRKREAALEERFGDLFENSNDIIYAHDLEGRITSSNNAAQATLGYTSSELLRMNVTDLVAPEDLEKSRKQMQAKLDGVTRTAYELKVRAKNGQWLILEVNSRLAFKDGAPVGVQGIARDITARKRAEEALRLSERQLRASLEERERLGRDLHDGIIQSIYAAGLNIEDCARVVTRDPENVERRLRKVMGDMNRVIREVRDFIMGLERHRLKGDEFKAALKSLALTIGESQTTRVELTVDDRAADELTPPEATQLLHIAREALSNAIKHARAQKVVFHLRSGESGIYFEISDDGIGFNPAACEGNGYGLRNMAARAGEIKAAFQIISQTGEGARIVLDMPRESSKEFARENPLAHR